MVQFIDELSVEIEESMTSDKYREAFEDARLRSRLVDDLVRIRKACHITQKQVAARMEVKQPTVSGFENEGSDPRLSTLLRYARAVSAALTIRVHLPADAAWGDRNPCYRSVSGEDGIIQARVTRPSSGWGHETSVWREAVSA